MGFLGVLRVKMWKYCVLTPKRHYPAWIRVCWCIACQNRFNGLSSRSVKIFLRTKKFKKKLSGNFGYMGRSNPWGNLDQMRLVGRYRGRNHVCNISWLSVKGRGCGERGKFAFSHWLHASPLQHWSHYRVTVWCLAAQTVAAIHLSSCWWLTFTFTRAPSCRACDTKFRTSHQTRGLPIQQTSIL